MYHRTFALLMLLSAAVAGQQVQTTVLTSFYAFDYAPDHESVFLPVAGGAAFEEIRLSTANIVGPVACVFTDGKLTIHSKPVTGADGKVTHPVIGSGVITNDIRKSLVVLFPQPKESAEKYRAIVLNNDLTDFPLGAYRIINLSNKTVRGVIAKQLVGAKPGGVANLAPQGEPGAIVPVRFEFIEEERWTLLTETRAAIRKDRRWLMCIYQDPATGRMNIRSIPDRTTTAPEGQTSGPAPP